MAKVSDLKIISPQRLVTLWYSGAGLREAQRIEFHKGIETPVSAALWAELLKKDAVKRYMDHGVLREVRAEVRVSDDPPQDLPAQVAAEAIGSGMDAAAAVAQTLKARR